MYGLSELKFVVADLFEAVMPPDGAGSAVTTVDYIDGQTIIITAEPPDPQTGAWSIIVQGEAMN